MSAFAMFSLKDPSMLAFEERRKAEYSNLKSIYQINQIPCNTQMRTILDEVSPDELQPAYHAVLAEVQRGKVLEPMQYIEEGYLVPLDGTGYFSSVKLCSPFCLRKTNSATGKTTYHLQMLGAVIAHPERREVIPLIPEIISRQDGADKKRLRDERQQSTAHGFAKRSPALENRRGPGCHQSQRPLHQLPQRAGLPLHPDRQGKRSPAPVCSIRSCHRPSRSPGMCPRRPERSSEGPLFPLAHGLAINASHQDVRVNVLEYWQVRGETTKRFCWVTDISLSEDNVYRVMRAGRARWKIENETFNTLKNQGYHFEHNYGLGHKHLSMVFVKLMMLAFLVDQVQQLSCSLFRSVWKKLGSKRELWEQMRALFRCFRLESMEMLYLALLHGFVLPELIITPDTS